MTRRFAFSFVAVGVIALAVVSMSSVGAITNGTVDDPANPRHPEVVILETGLSAGGSEQCTGSLMTPTKVVTAAHCFVGMVGRTIVSAQTPAPDRPVPTPVGGWTAAPAGWVLGDAVVHPLSDIGVFPPVYDVAVVTLDTPLTGIPLAHLAPTGYIDSLNARPGGVQNATFEVVGYGTSVVKPATPPKVKEEVGDLTRRFATVTGKTTFKTNYIEAKTNYNSANADGAVCHGDSGGPLIHEGVVVGVLSWGRNSLCLAWSSWQRTDVPSVSIFLAVNGIIAS